MNKLLQVVSELALNCNVLSENNELLGSVHLVYYLP